MKITSIISNWQSLDGGSMFGHVPRALWSRWYKVDEYSRIRLACRCFLIEIGDFKCILETGVGAYMSPKEKKMYGVESDRHLLLDGLGNLGVSADEIDAIVLSHMHFDHAGGLLPSRDEIEEKGEFLVFPEAKYYVSKEAFERAQTPHIRDQPPTFKVCRKCL